MIAHQTALFDLAALGAAGDGITDNTQVFREALAACAKAGGGTVVVPAGRFMTGPFQIFSNTEFRVEAGAEILASTNIEDYFVDGSSMESSRIGLIYARKAENITVTGRGSIDFQGTAFMDMTKLTPWVDFDREGTRNLVNFLNGTGNIGDGPVMVLDRPGNLVQFLECQNVVLSQLTLKNAPNWTVQFGNSRDVFVHGLRILNNLLIANSDGVHCTSCSNVHISDCHIESGDDSIAITSLTAAGRACENVTVTNCTLLSRSAGIRVGYGEGDIRNCLFQNLTIEANRGLAVFARNNYTISEISFDHINIRTRLHDGQWWGHGEPIHVSAVRADADIPAGTIRNISFSRITAESESGIVIYASEKGQLSQLRLQEIYLTIKTGSLAKAYGGNFDLRPAFDPKEKLFEHDEGGLFAQNVAYLRVKDLTLLWEGTPAETFTYGLYAEGCDEVSVQAFRCPANQGKPNLRTIELKNCTVEN